MSLLAQLEDERHRVVAEQHRLKARQHLLDREIPRLRAGESPEIVAARLRVAVGKLEAPSTR